TKLLRFVGIVASGSTFEEALCVFNNAMEIDFLSNPSEMALWQSQREDHTLDWLRVVSISRLGQTMNAGILAGKEVNIGLNGGSDKKLHPADMLLYSWDRGLNVCVDLTGSSPLTQTRMTDFATGQVVSDAAHRKRSKYMAKCAAIGYGFLSFSFSSLRELEADVVTLLKRIQKFSMAQDIGARATIHIFNRITFAIAKGVRAQIVFWLPINLLLDGLDLEFVQAGRIDRRLHIGLPDAKQRVQISGVHSTWKQLAEDVEFENVIFWNFIF
nr:putative reverse transcriptase domain-containing protein [Tanacetum cinerariifolium]